MQYTAIIVEEIRNPNKRNIVRNEFKSLMKRKRADRKGLLPLYKLLVRGLKIN